jgi:amicoumacin kinase
MGKDNNLNDERPLRSLPFTPVEMANLPRYWRPNATLGQILGAWENFVFVLEDGKHSAVVRITESSRRSREEVEAELCFVDHLLKNGFPVPAVLLNTDGERTKVVDFGDSGYILCVFERFVGESVSADSVLDVPDGAVAWGELIADLHLLSRSFDRECYRKSWAENELLGFEKNHLPHEFRSTLNDVLVSLAKQDRTDQNFGLVHADLHGRNVLQNCRGRVVIDFDDCCFHWYCYDLAVALNWLTFSSDSDIIYKKLVTMLLSGYERKMSSGADAQELTLKLAYLRCALDYLFVQKRINEAVGVEMLLHRMKFLKRQLTLLRSLID